MVYNETFLNTSNTLTDVVTGLNTASNGVLFSTLLLVIFVIVFIATKRYDTKVSFIASSFATSLVGLFFMFAGFITWAILFIPIGLLVMSLIIKWISDN